MAVLRRRAQPTHATPRMEPQSLDKDARPAPGGESFGRLKRRADFQRVSRGRRKSVEAFTASFAALVEDLRETFRAIQRGERDGRRPAAPATPKGRDRRP